MVGIGEVESDTGLVFDMLIGMELGAVVGGNCCEGALLATDKLNDFLIELGGGPGSELPDEEVFGFSFDDGDDAVVIVGAKDGVDFPMAEARAILSTRGSLRDVALSGEDPPRIVGSVAFPAFLQRLA